MTNRQTSIRLKEISPAESVQVFLGILLVIFLFYVQVIRNGPVMRGFSPFRYIIRRNLQPGYVMYLAINFRFYNALSDVEKKKFERRVQKFIDIKEFVPRGGIIEVTPEMKVLIAGTAIQLTYGYPDIYFVHFWRILVYPDSYYSTITHRFHQGEVNPRGLIVLSWKSFKEGFARPADGINLGYHEMAHALRLINIIDNDEYDFYDRSVMEAFEREAGTEIARLKKSDDRFAFFRPYSFTNIDEFFAVTVENFFERASALKQYNSTLYHLMTQILRIDPELLMKSEAVSI